MINLPDLETIWDFDHPEETERRFENLLVSAKGSSDRTYVIELLSDLARAQGLQKKYDAAIPYIENDIENCVRKQEWNNAAYCHMFFEQNL